MEATDEEILRVGRNPELRDVNKARRENSKIYHTDKHQRLEAGVQDVLNMLMKETNAAADRVLSRLRRDRKS